MFRIRSIVTAFHIAESYNKIVDILFNNKSMQEQLAKELRKTCDHKTTYFYDKEWPTGEAIEICSTCDMSRSHWEQGESNWLYIKDIDKAHKELVELLVNIREPERISK